MEMDKKTLQNLRTRTDAKLRYAQVHLDEMKSAGIIGGSDFDRAHLESFLFHLLGAKDAFIIELNEYYECNLPGSELTAGKLRGKLEKDGRHSPELAELFALEQDERSWFSQAKAMRDFSTHVRGIPHNFHLGGQADGEIWLQDPSNGENIPRHFVDVFADWLSYMNKLLEHLRETAIRDIASSKNSNFR